MGISINFWWKILIEESINHAQFREDIASKKKEVQYVCVYWITHYGDFSPWNFCESMEIYDTRFYFVVIWEFYVFVYC